MEPDLPLAASQVARASGAIAAVLSDLASSHFANPTTIKAHTMREACDYLGRLLSPHDLSLGGAHQSLCLSHNTAQLRDLTFHFIDYGCTQHGVTVRAPELSDNLLLQLPISGTAQLSQGRGIYQIAPGRLFLAVPHWPLLAEMSPDYRQLTLQIPSSLLLRALRQEFGTYAPDAVHFDLEEINSSAAPALLLNTLNMLCQAMATDSARIAQPMLQKSMQDALLAIILTFPNSFTPQISAQISNVAPHYINRAETFMRQNRTETIGLDDLVQASGVSRRSLHAGFRRFRQCSPMGMLKSLRLAAAHRDLRDEALIGESVTQVAMRYGFYHLSNFAKDFKDSFGVLPSELRRTSQPVRHQGSVAVEFQTKQ